MVGNDYNAHSLWDKYIEFEKSRSETLKVTNLYRRVISSYVGPVKRYLDEFKKWIDFYPFDQLVSQDENEKLIKSMIEEEAKLNPEAPPKQVSDEEKKIKWLEGIESIAAATMEYVSHLVSFEDKIKRPYFHVKALDEPQLQNWRDYLSYQESKGKDHHDRIVKLYERCLIACCNYSEFWFRYAHYLESNNLIDECHALLERVTTTALKRNPDAFLYYASFLEGQNKIDEAQKIFAKAQEICPKLIEYYITKAHFERRQSNLTGAIAVLEEGIKNCSESNSDTAVLELTLAKLLQQKSSHYNDKIIELFESAITHLPNSVQIWSEYLKFFCGNKPENDKVKGLFERFIKCDSLDELDKYNVWSWYLDQVMNGSDNVSLLRDLQSRFLIQFPNDPPSVKSTNKKRSIEDDPNDSNKKQKLDGEVAAQYPTQLTHEQWAMMYAQGMYGGAAPQVAMYAQPQQPAVIPQVFGAIPQVVQPQQAYPTQYYAPQVQQPQQGYYY